MRSREQRPTRHGCQPRARRRRSPPQVRRAPQRRQRERRERRERGRRVLQEALSRNDDNHHPRNEGNQREEERHGGSPPFTLIEGGLSPPRSTRSSWGAPAATARASTVATMGWRPRVDGSGRHLPEVAATHRTRVPSNDVPLKAPSAREPQLRWATVASLAEDEGLVGPPHPQLVARELEPLSVSSSASKTGRSNSVSSVVVSWLSPASQNTTSSAPTPMTTPSEPAA